MIWLNLAAAAGLDASGILPDHRTPPPARCNDHSSHNRIHYTNYQLQFARITKVYALAILQFLNIVACGFIPASSRYSQTSYFHNLERLWCSRYSHQAELAKIVIAYRGNQDQGILYLHIKAILR